MKTEFIGQRRISVNMAKRKDGSVCCTGTKFYIPEEEVGTVVFVKPTKNGFEILKNKKEGSIEKEVKGIYNPLTGKNQTYLNFRNLVDESLLYDCYREKDGYMLKISKTQTPIKSIKGGRNKIVVDANNCIGIPESYFRPLCKDKNLDDYCLAIKETLNPTQSVKITLVPQDEPVKVSPKLNISVRKISEDKYIRKIKATKTFRLSRFFVTAADLHTGDILYCRWNGSNSIVIEKVEKCDICGRPVNQSHESLMKLDVCQSCSGAIKILKKYTDKEHDLRNVKKALEVLKNQVYEIRNMEEK